MLRLVAVTALLLAVAVAPDPAAAAPPRDVAAAARAGGLARVADARAVAARPSLRVRRSVVRWAPRARGTSRLGGAPDLPAGVRWPRCAGRPMAFLGQLRLADAAAGGAAAAGLPPTGLLSFFAAVEEDGAGSRFWSWGGRCARVLRSDAGVSLVRRRAPRANPRMVLRPATVRFVPEQTLPVTPPIALSNREARAYEALRGRLSPVRFTGLQWGPVHRLLGHPDAEQEDPVASCPGGPAAGWRTLLGFDWDVRLGYEVADGGHQFVLVREDDLRVGSFDRVCSVFESA